MSERILSFLSAAGSTLTNSTSATVLASHTFPAGFWQPGKVVRVRGLVKVPSTNSTDTLTLVTRLGAVAVSGTSLGTTGAVDVANDDIGVVLGEIVCLSITSAGVATVAYQVATVLDAAGTALTAHGSTKADLDNTAASYLAITGAWSVASASNQCAAHMFTVSELA